MAFKQQDTSFLGFVEEFFKTPVNFPKNVYALYVKGKERTVTLVSVRSPQSNETDSSFISTFVAGGPEALKDVKGINTAVSAEDLFKNPLKTVKTLGEKTFKDITSLDEISSDKRSDVLEGLTKGTLSQRGKDILSPQSDVVRNLKRLGLNLVNPDDLTETTPTITTPGGEVRSAIQLLGTPHAATAPSDDRQLIEQNKKRDVKYKAYRDLAGGLTALAGYMETVKPRQKFYTETVTAYNRSVLSELGIDLDEVLPVKGKRGLDPSVNAVRLHDTKGSFSDELYAGQRAFTTANENLEDLLNNDTRLRKALSLSSGDPYNDALWNNLDPTTKEVIKASLESEFVNQGLYTSLKGSAGKTAFETDLGTGLTSFVAKQKYIDPTGKEKDSGLKEGIVERETNRRALEAQIKAQLNDPELKARIANAARIQVEKQSLLNLNQELGLPTGSITSLTDSRIPTSRLTDIQNDIANASDRAIERHLAAVKSANVSNNLFFAATMNEFLESIEKGSFVETALISTRMVGMIPFVNAKLGSPEEYTQILDKVGIPGTALNVGRAVSKAAAIKTSVFAGLGVAFDEVDDVKNLPLIPKIANKLTGGVASKAFEADVWVEWNRETARPGFAQWTQTRIAPSQAEGLFGEWGVHDTFVKTWGEEGSLFKSAGFTNPSDFNPEILLGDTARAQAFFADLKSGAENVMRTGNATTDFERLAKMIGLTDFVFDPSTGAPIIGANGLPQFLKFEAFEKQFVKMNAPGGGFSLLERLGDATQTPGSFPLNPRDRWAFLTRILKEGKTGQLVNKSGNAVKYIGLLNKYNRAANAAYIFFYRELLGGGYAGSNIFFKGVSKILKPLRGLGFADEVLISEAISNWGMVKWFKGLSTKLFTMSENPALSTGRNLFLKALGTTGLKSLGFIASGAAGTMTAGLSYLISSVGEMGWAFAKSVLWDSRGRIDLAIKASVAVVTNKIRTIKRLIMGVILLGLTCLAIPIIFTFAILAILSSLEPSTGGGAYSDVVGSKKIAVEKTAVQTGDNIEYKITITNITDKSTDPSIPPQDITITSFTDTLNYAKSCAAGGGIVDVTSDPSLGSITLPAIGSVPKTTLAPGETTEVGPFTLRGISPDDGTYLNSVEVLIDGDDKKGEDTVSTKIGIGGCAVCPAGWPTQPFTLTQGAQTYDSHKNAEALDLASGIGQAIRATHNGIAYTFSNKCSDDDHSKVCGYGNYIEVVSPLGFSTIYAHMVGFEVNNKREVAANEIIGYMGTTGNSTGSHLHYEFKNTSVQCIPGKNLRMYYYADPQYPESYIPENIPNPNCVGSASCNMSR